MRWLRRLLTGAGALIAVAALVFWLARGPSPKEILASIEVPPSPLLSPEEAQAAFRVAPGFRVELVASEPMVVDPVAMDWDEAGRLYVVEMRGFMPDIDANGEEVPVGRVVVLEDTNADGRMDRSHVFLDGLVMPRAVAVLPQGVLIGEPGNLWLCRDTNADLRCDEKLRLGGYAFGGTNPEHLENGLLVGLDGWIYNAKSDRRLRVRDGALEVSPTAFRGQWGIAQDDHGRLFYNHNSGFLYGDAFPADYASRHPATQAASGRPGINLPLSDGELVWGVRVAPGLNRAYLRGTLRADGRQAGPTAVSGLAIQRGDQFGPEYRGHAFVPESGGAAVAHFAVRASENALSAEHRLYPDDEWEQREFLASTDERFRPVDADFGPDGALWVIDMYRGVVQHAEFVSDHLRAYVEEHGLESPGEHGRIWRVVRNDRPIEYAPPPLATVDEQLAALDHANGWVRDRAQRRIVHDAKPAAIAGLRTLSAQIPEARVQRLWALHGLDALDAETWALALGDDSPAVRRAALRVGERLLASGDAARIEHALRMRDDPDASVRLQALHSLGEAPAAARPLEALLDALAGRDALEGQAALSGLEGLEMAALDRALAALDGRAPDDDEAARIGQLAGALHLAGQADDADALSSAAALDRIASLTHPEQQAAALAGVVEAQRKPAARRVELAAPHPLFAAADDRPDEIVNLLEDVRIFVTWPGDPRPGGARALSSAEAARREQGAVLYARTCATCHGASGMGNAGLAPALRASPWVRNADAWLVRIALHGLTGPLRIDGVEWNQTMPGHGHDPRFDDEALAGLLTHLRRSWGHAEDPVAPETVARIRAAEAARKTPWTVAELEALPIEHRLDRYVGVYEVPIVGIEMAVRRVGNRIAVGRKRGGAQELDELGNHRFVGPDLGMRFAMDEDGAVSGAEFDYQGTAVNLSKTE